MRSIRSTGPSGTAWPSLDPGDPGRARHADSIAWPDSGFVVFADVQKTYDGETLVVRDLNLSISRGEFLTLLGPFGSGKTATLMMLAGFETPTGGQIFLDGRAINALAPYKRNIGMVFQNYALFPHMTVGENLAFPLQVRRLGREDFLIKVPVGRSEASLAPGAPIRVTWRPEDCRALDRI